MTRAEKDVERAKQTYQTKILVEIKAEVHAIRTLSSKRENR
jgi:hypothetical protein